MFSPSLSMDDGCSTAESPADPQREGGKQLVAREGADRVRWKAKQSSVGGGAFSTVHPGTTALLSLSLSLSPFTEHVHLCIH